MKSGYQTDLAYIHDAGFTDFMREAAPAVLKILQRNRITHGLVIDLGCGSGVWARTLISRGYDVLGIDLSPAMLRIARGRVPQAKFVQVSLFQAKLPKCSAVTAIGECLNYAFDRSAKAKLEGLFRRIHSALDPGGLFVFDIAQPGRVGRGPTHNYFQGKDWAILVRNEEDQRRRCLTRRMTIFRRIGSLYRRSEVVHQQNLLDPARIEATLRNSGFKVTRVSGYGKRRLGRGRSAFIALKT